ncbi:hypothetical protein C9374_009050 [Naegleria lovaniensis]|uniref:Uncharacterized protein n=1 Tax=Naegleria lovaniensis TaxID=51637 RepID=A0AA88KK66_NAELO|nr:uncharacterized protein C9374_009050 [Naegleria lovaniensis]KAG2377534.1 hypothetical protein C9374_009050 [Naegleria lovaniensis]
MKTTTGEEYMVRSYYRYCSTRETAPVGLDQKDVIIYLTTKPVVPKKIRKEIRICDFLQNHQQFNVEPSLLSSDHEDTNNETSQRTQDEDESTEPPTKKKKE